MSSPSDRFSRLKENLQSLQTKIEVRRASRMDGIETSLIDVEKQEGDSQIAFEAQTQAIAQAFLQIDKKIKDSHEQLDQLGATFDEKLEGLQQEVRSLLASATEERQESQNVLNKNIDDALRELQAEISSLGRGYADEADALGDGITRQLAGLKGMIADEGDDIKVTEGRLRDSAGRAFGAVEKKLQEEEDKCARSVKALRELLTVVESQFDREFKKLREERKAGEDALVDLLEKMANNFIAIAD